MLDNLGLARKVANRYVGRAGVLDFDDLLQEATLGLMRAARDFDPNRTRFSTYGTLWANKYVQVAIDHGGDTIRTPPKLRVLALKIDRLLDAEPGLTIGEIAERLECTQAQACAALALARVVTSLDTPLDATGDTLADRIRAPIEPDPEALELLEPLTDIERRVLVLREGYGVSWPEIERELELPRNGPQGAVSRTIAERALETLSGRSNYLETPRTTPIYE